MSLPSLQWRRLPTIVFPVGETLTGSYLLNSMYNVLTSSFYSDGSARVMGSGSAWQMPTKFVTGSNTEAIYLFPPYQTSISQSVIYAARSSIGASSPNVAPDITGGGGGNNIAGASTKITGNADEIYVAAVKSASGSFTQWTSRYPFGSGSYMTGYTPVSDPGYNTLSSGDKLTIYESKEAIATMCIVGGNPVFTIVGAIIDPEQPGATGSADVETDGRLYGIAQAGRARDNNNNPSPAYHALDGFLTDTLGLFYHGTDSATLTLGKLYPKFLMFSPTSLTTLLTLTAAKFQTDTFATSAPYDTIITTPLRCSSISTGNFVGRVRDIVAIKNNFNNMTMRDSANNILGYTISYNEAASGNAVLLPYS